MLPQGPSPIQGTLTQVSYMLSGFSFLRVDLEETVTTQWARRMPSPMALTAEAASGSSLGHRQLVARNKAIWPNLSSGHQAQI